MSKFLHVSKELGVKAEVVITSHRNGPYAVIVSDLDTGSQVGIKYFRDVAEAVAYAALCVKDMS